VGCGRDRRLGGKGSRGEEGEGSRRGDAMRSCTRGCVCVCGGRSQVRGLRVSVVASSGCPARAHRDHTRSGDARRRQLRRRCKSKSPGCMCRALAVAGCGLFRPENLRRSVQASRRCGEALAVHTADAGVSTSVEFDPIQVRALGDDSHVGCARKIDKE
jgi:hypothetical protein